MGRLCVSIITNFHDNWSYKNNESDEIKICINDTHTYII